MSGLTRVNPNTNPNFHSQTIHSQQAWSVHVKKTTGQPLSPSRALDIDRSSGAIYYILLQIILYTYIRCLGLICRGIYRVNPNTNPNFHSQTIHSQQAWSVHVKKTTGQPLSPSRALEDS